MGQWVGGTFSDSRKYIYAQRRVKLVAATNVYRSGNMKLVGCRCSWCQDTSDPGHFGPKIFWHHDIGAEVSRQICTSAEMSRGEC